MAGLSGRNSGKFIQKWFRRGPLRAGLTDREGTPKNFFDKDFAELSGELSGAICLETLVLMGNDR